MAKRTLTYGILPILSFPQVFVGNPEFVFSQTKAKDPGSPDRVEDDRGRPKKEENASLWRYIPASAGVAAPPSREFYSGARTV